MSDTTLIIGWLIYFVIGALLAFLDYRQHRTTFVYWILILMMFWPVLLIANILCIKIERGDE